MARPMVVQSVMAIWLALTPMYSEAEVALASSISPTMP